MYFAKSFYLFKKYSGWLTLGREQAKACSGILKRDPGPESPFFPQASDSGFLRITPPLPGRNGDLSVSSSEGLRKTHAALAVSESGAA